MFPVNVIRRAGVVFAAAVVAPMVALAAGGCGSAAGIGAAAAAGGATNGLQAKSPDQVIHAAAGALRTARSVEFTMTPPIAARRPYTVTGIQIQGDARIMVVMARGRPQFEIAVVGKDAYIEFSTAGMKLPYWLSPLRHVFAGRWFRMSTTARDIASFPRLSLAALADLLARPGPLASGVGQATLNGRPVVVVTTQDGSKLYVANTGPAYPVLFISPDGHQRLELTHYGANFHIPTPRNALPGGPSYAGPGLA
jgi:hypothetical protein